MRKMDQVQIDLWTAVLPPELWELPKELATVDGLLADDSILAPLAEPLHPTQGRPSVACAQILRLFYLQHAYGLSDRELMQEASDSLHWRRFCHFGLGDRLPHPTTLTVWRRRLGPDRIQAVNEAVVARLHQRKIIRGRRFRQDSTVIEADIEYPTDAGLLAKGIRALTRLGRKLSSVMGTTETKVPDRRRVVTRRLLAISKLLRRRTGAAVQDVRRITGEMERIAAQQLRRVEPLLQQAAESTVKIVQRLRGSTQELVDRVERLIQQSRAVTNGQRHFQDRLISLADPEARPIVKGKLGRRVEFGYKVQVIEAEGGFVTDYTVETGNPPDTEALLPALDRHRVRFGRDPAIVATDRGYDSADNQDSCKDRGIRTVAIPKRGRKSKDRRAFERRPGFRSAQRWRANGEATIGRLKQRYGLRRSRYRGRDRVATGVGLGILAHNVRRWARQQAS